MFAVARYCFSCKTSGGMRPLTGFAITLSFAAMTLRAEPARGQSTEVKLPVMVWYRSSTGCPDGASFLERLAQRGVSARLAGVGDKVDFVVTVGTLGADGSGRLERQTARGTIAIRELSATSCAEVSDAMALSLGLAVEETAESPAAVSPALEVHPNAPSPSPHSAAPVARSDRAEEAPKSDVPPHSLGSPPRPSGSKWSAGANGFVAAGLAPGLTGGAGLFGSFAPWREQGSHANLRSSLFLHRRSEGTDAGDLRLTLAAFRAEGCPVGFGGAHVRAEGCAGLELGGIVAEGTGADGVRVVRPWAAAAALARLRFLGRGFALEAQAGAVIPFSRYRLLFSGPAGSRSAHRTASVAFQAGLGAGVELP
jgi:hypothetical protein